MCRYQCCDLWVFSAPSVLKDFHLITRGRGEDVESITGRIDEKLLLSQVRRPEAMRMLMAESCRLFSEALSEERGEDPLVVALDAVVCDDRIAAAAARDADEGAARVRRIVLAARSFFLLSYTNNAADRNDVLLQKGCKPRIP